MTPTIQFAGATPGDKAATAIMPPAPAVVANNSPVKIMSGPQRLGGASASRSANSAHNTRAGSNSSDLELGALCFALFGLTCPFAIAGAVITIYLLFFS